MCKVKEIKGLRGGVLKYAAQEILKIDTEIAQKGHVWMETAMKRAVVKGKIPVIRDSNKIDSYLFSYDVG